MQIRENQIVTSRGPGASVRVSERARSGNSVREQDRGAHLAARLTRLGCEEHNKFRTREAEESDARASGEYLVGAGTSYRSLLPLRDIMAADKNKLALTETDRSAHPRARASTNRSRARMYSRVCDR